MSRAVVSFSGGKDSNLALHKAKKSGYTIAGIIVMMCEDKLVSRSNAVPLTVVQGQAKMLGVELIYCQTTWADYEKDFTRLLARAVKELQIDTCIFGDIDLLGHREWGERVTSKVGLTATYPLWEEKREDLMAELLSKQFEMIISVIDLRHLPQEFLGKAIDEEMVDEFRKRGIDLSGENGEYHTVVTNSPDYQCKIDVKSCGTIQVDENHIVWMFE